MGGTSVATGRGIDYYESHAREGLKAAEARGYYSKAVASGEPRAELLGAGLEGLGLSLGRELDDTVAQATWSHLCHPETGEQLGQAIARYAAPGERLLRAAERSGLVPASVTRDLRAAEVPDIDVVEAALAPHFTPEELTGMRRRASRSQRETVTFYDTLYTQDKSVSVAHAAADAAGDDRASEACEDALRKASEAVVAFIDDTMYVRVGDHGKSVEGRSTGRYERVLGTSVAAYRHHTSRAGDMHDHVHLLVLNRAQSEPGGKYRALDGTMLYNSMSATTALGSRASEMHLTAELGWRWDKRHDGTRYLPAVDEALVGQFSKRAAAIEERLDQWSSAFEAQMGRAPSARERDRQHRDIQRRTRAAKPDKVVVRSESVSAWDAEVADSLGDAHKALDQDAEKWLRAGGPDEVIDTEAVLTQALEQLSEKRSSFSRWHLLGEIDKAMPANLPTGMTFPQYRQIVMDLVGDGVRRLGIEALTPVGVLDRNVPTSFVTPEGRSVYSPPDNDRYAMTKTLAHEAYLLGRLQRRQSPGVSPEQAAAAVEAAGLSGDQRQAVEAVLSSHRDVEVLVGPAGTGKSFTVAKLAEAWKSEGLGEVIGLAKSNAAAAVLAGEGIERAWNCDRWLAAQARMADGRGRPMDGRMKLSPGTLVVVDEASMAETETLARVVEAVSRSGGKVLLTGDQRQLEAVGAGGFFALAADDVELQADGAVLELTTVRRFQAPWEGEASLRLRAGDETVLSDYDDHGRLVGLVDEDALDYVAEQWVTDHLQGKDVVAVVATTEEASSLSMKIRGELVALGRVDASLSAPLAGGALGGRGDVIQTRENSYKVVDSKGTAVSNRDRWTLERVYSDGSVDARRLDGKATVHFEADYVSQQVELAYARTAHGAQGLTVDRCYDVITDATTAPALYVGMTRGKEANIAVVDVSPVTDDHGHSPDEPRDALDVVAEVIARDRSERSAVAEQRAQLEASKSLARLGPAWEAVVGLHEAEIDREAVAEVLGPQRMARLDADDSSDAFWHQLAITKRDGYDHLDALRSTLAGREVDSSQDLGPLLAWRLSGQHHMAWEPHRVPGAEEAGRPGGLTYLERSPEPDSLAPDGLVPDSYGIYARQLAVAMDERVAELGKRCAAEAPQWATEALGPVPSPGEAREAWEARAGRVAGYREQYVATRHIDTADPIGPAPNRLAVPERHYAWSQARKALGLESSVGLDVRRAKSSQLRLAVAAWKAEAAEAPVYVRHDLDPARREAQRKRGRLERLEATMAATWATADQVGPRAAERAKVLRAETEEAEAYVETLQAAHLRRAEWFKETATTRTTAHEAAAELERRGESVDKAVKAEPEEMSVVDLRRYEARLERQDQQRESIGLSLDRSGRGR